MYFQDMYWSDSCPHGVLTKRYQHPTNGIAKFMVTIHLTISIMNDLMSQISYLSYELSPRKLSMLI